MKRWLLGIPRDKSVLDGKSLVRSDKRSKRRIGASGFRNQGKGCISRGTVQFH